MTRVLKRWSVNAFAEGMSPISYFCDGRPLARESPAEREEASPVEHLLIGIAGCLALSCRAIFLKRHLRGIDLEIVVTGEKSAERGNLLSAIVVSAIFRGQLTNAEAAAIVEEAKPLCTVGNTISSVPNLRYETQTIRPRRPSGEPVPMLPERCIAR